MSSIRMGGVRRLHMILLLMMLVVMALSSAIPPPEDHKSRVFDKRLSDEDHYAGDDDDGLDDDDDDDDDGEGHNKEFDHEAFLGKEQAREFEQMTPDESKEKLAIIYGKIDTDGSGTVSEEELVTWIRYVQNRYVRTDTDRQWKDFIPSSSSETELTWENYAQRTYGRTDIPVKDDNKKPGNDDNDDDDDDDDNYDNMMRRDKKRWAKADVDGDGTLSKDEFADFLHPEDVDRMKDVVIDETMEDIDKDKDGYISLEEYIGDMFPGSQNGEPEPDWVKTEREQFGLFRDKDKDGKMSRDEVMDWIIPPDYDHANAEAKHLIHESDADKDGSLTKEEVLNKYDLFVGSQATDFGDALTKHDEF